MSQHIEKFSASLPDLPLERWPSRVWELLDLAVGAPGDPLRTPGLANCSEAGPHLRTVVLRRVQPSLRLMLVYTDLRSAKAGQLQQDQRTAWLFYDAGRALQIRLDGRVRLHAGDALAEECWATLGEISRGNYLAMPGPGLALTPARTANPPRVARADAGLGLANFGVLACTVHAMDCLCLVDSGNIRARFDWESTAWRGSWLCP